jgi:molecular chaperone DnaJ
MDTMTDKRDYYEVLGVGRTATADEIRRAYRTLARAHHPDVNRDDGAEERFKEINEAYEVLSDADRRAAYDRFGHAANGMGGRGDPFGFGGSPFGDLFETFFGGAAAGGSRRRNEPRRGADLQETVTLSFEEAVFGVEQDVDVTRLEACEACHGTRMRDGQTPPRCSTCGGSGEVRRVQQTILGQFMTAAPCSACGGEGVQISDPCPSCRGRGRINRTRTVSISVPAGVDDGATLRVPGKGEVGPNGGPPGNLFVKIRVRPHELFTRTGKTIQLGIGINVAQAALGDEVEVQTLEGPVALKIPAGTQSGQQFRLRGRGVPDLRGGERGDQLVTIQVVIPRQLTDEQRELFARLGGSLGSEIQQQPAQRGFFDRVKDALGV